MFTINTYIRDIDTNEALPFASVVVTDSKGKAMPVNGVVVGRKTDEEGRLIIPIAIETAFITVSYVGYQTITHPADDYRNDTIYLAKKASNLFTTGKDIIVKAKRIYKQAAPSKKATAPAKKIAWYVYASVAAGVILTGIIIYKIVKK